MAFVVKGRGNRWELRQSRNTPDGPRSVTLATFEELTAEVIEHAQSRAVSPFDVENAVRAALRAGAPVEISRTDRAARDLLRELTAGGLLRPGLKQLLADALGGTATALSSAARSAGEWAGATQRERADALVDLLLLADAIPPSGAPREQRFPRLGPAVAKKPGPATG